MPRTTHRETGSPTKNLPRAVSSPRSSGFVQPGRHRRRHLLNRRFKYLNLETVLWVRVDALRTSPLFASSLLTKARLAPSSSPAPPPRDDAFEPHLADVPEYALAIVGEVRVQTQT